MAQADCNLTEEHSVMFITGDAVEELSRVKAAGDGGMIACGEKIAAMQLNNGLADEMVVIMLLKVAGGNGMAWVVRSCKVTDGKEEMRK